MNKNNNFCAFNYTIMTHPVHAVQGLKLVLITSGDASDQEPYELNMSYRPLSNNSLGFLSHFIFYVLSVWSEAQYIEYKHITLFTIQNQLHVSANIYIATFRLTKKIKKLGISPLFFCSESDGGYLLAETRSWFWCDMIYLLGTVVAQWLRYCATNRKVAGSIPAGVTGFFIDIESFRSYYGPGVD